MIKGAIFDVDGTLLDSMFIWNKVIDDFLQSIGAEPGKEFYDKMETLDLQLGCAFMKETFDLSGTVEEIKQDVINSVDRFYRYEVSDKPYVKEYLEYLKSKNVKCTVATAGDTGLVKACFERLGIVGYFSEFFSCSQLNTDKSRPDIYLTAARFMGVLPEETAVYEDAPHAVKTAKIAGFKTVGIHADGCRDSEEVRKYSDRYIYSYSEIIGEEI